MDDQRLLQLLRTDPNSGMEQLMDQYTGLVYTVVSARLSDGSCLSTDVEDCVADVFSTFYLELEKFDPTRCGIKAYLCVMARNMAINLAKKQSRRLGAVSLNDEQASFQLADDVLLEAQLTEQELRREVLRAVEQLGEPDTSILFRRYYYGETAKQIAEVLGISVANVDTRAHRAINRLKTVFGGTSA